MQALPPPDAEVMTPSADLAAAAALINRTIDSITGHEEAFEEATLEPRLLIGLEIARARELFGMTNAEAGALGGEAKASVSRRDTLESDPEPAPAPADGYIGLVGWLKKEIPRLKRPTALKYATAFETLGLDTSTATPAQIRERVKKLRHDAGKKGLPMPTLGSLYRESRPKGKMLIELPEPPPRLRLEDAREAWFFFEEKGRTLVMDGILDDLDKPGLEKLRDFNLWLRDRINARLKSI